MKSAHDVARMCFLKKAFLKCLKIILGNLQSAILLKHGLHRMCFPSEKGSRICAVTCVANYLRMCNKESITNA